jgi:hypothetical protein
VRLRHGSVVRGAGVALACLVPGFRGRTRAVVASYAAAWPLDKPGLQLLVVVPDDDAEPWRKAMLPFATSGASWTAVMLLAVSAVRRSALPAPVAAVALGGLVVAGDSAMADLAERTKARIAAARESDDAETGDG